MPDVVTLGEPLVVLLPAEPVGLDEAGALAVTVGGAEANTAMLLARLGHTVSYVSRVGDDPFGRRVVAAIAGAGVDVARVRVDPGAPTGLYAREWLPDGVRRVHYYRSGSAASRLSADDLDDELCAGARALLVSGITPALSPSCAAAVTRAIELARSAGALVALDLNYRPRLWAPAAARRALLPLLARVDLLLMSREDAAAILEADGEPALRAAAALGPRTVVLKAAEAGAAALADGVVARAPASPVLEVVDPVGAGDAFNAGFLSCVLRGGSVAEALRAGNELGAAAVTAPGDVTSRLPAPPLGLRGCPAVPPSASTDR
jgi:2-dehydro-3-deoxygluconokinase